MVTLTVLQSASDRVLLSSSGLQQLKRLFAASLDSPFTPREISSLCLEISAQLDAINCTDHAFFSAKYIEYNITMLCNFKLNKLQQNHSNAVNAKSLHFLV